MGEGLKIRFENGILSQENEVVFQKFLGEVYNFNLGYIMQKKTETTMKKYVGVFSEEKMQEIMQTLQMWLNRELNSWNRLLIIRMKKAIYDKHVEKCEMKSGVYDFVNTTSTHSLHTLLNLNLFQQFLKVS